jgi:uncharacterized GH25 family protein
MITFNTPSRSIAVRCVLWAALCAALPAAAHDIVLQPQSSGLSVRYGHPKDWQPLELRKLVELQAFGGQAEPRDLQPALKAKGLLYELSSAALGKEQGKALLLAARYDNGLWARVRLPGSAKLVAVNTTRVMLPEAEFVSNNLKFAKALLPAANDDGLHMRRLGHLLELVPQRNPATLKPGEPLPVLVLFKGQPLAGAGVEVSNLVDAVPEDQIRRYTTDAQGIAQVVLREKGIQMLGVDVERPNDGSLGEAAQKVGADKFVLVATYTFVR